MYNLLRICLIVYMRAVINKRDCGDYTGYTGLMISCLVAVLSLLTSLLYDVLECVGWLAGSTPYSKVDCRPEGYLSFLHPVSRESPAVAREGPLGRRTRGPERFVWFLTVRPWQQQAQAGG